MENSFSVSFLRALVLTCILFLILALRSFAQVPANINSGNPNHPFPQFKGYTGGVNTLAQINPVGVPHAEMEQRIRDGYAQMCNDMSYTIYDNGVPGPVTFAGVKYIAPNQNASSNIGHCHCVEGDGYYLIAAAYMADKATFDGYYMYIHDREFQNTPRFIDNVVNNPTYYGNPGLAGSGSPYNGDVSRLNVRGGGCYGGAALDGNEDVALALLMAWKQWGDNAVIFHNPWTGLDVTYKGEAIKFIKAMVDPVTTPWSTTKPGVIGLDGYRKSGDVTADVTSWGNAGAWMGMIPDNPGPADCGDCGGFYNTYADYAAPAYFRSFADMLAAEGQPAWHINQYRRGEASDTWIFGQAYSQGLIPWAGLYKVNEAGAGTTITFSNMIEGEDFRYGWRTIMNYMWNGAPTINWNPATHNYQPGTNTYEYDMALRFAGFLKNAQAAPYNNPTETIGNMTFCGVPTLLNHYAPDGTPAPPPARVPPRYWPINWTHGTGAPAAVVSQDFDMMAQMFRECVIKWDQNGTTQEYLTSKPQYFHEFFRMLGMLILTGNMPDPMDVDMNAAVANMKVYKAVNKTYAGAGDTITYTISYRNYAKANASNVVITDNLPAGLTFVSATGGGTATGSTVTWNIGAVPGFVTGGLAATMGSVTLKVRVSSTASGRICNTATITCSNGTGWTSNEYPNNITDVMERNCVDIITDNPLSISKKGSRATVMVGDTVSYTIVVKNKPVPFLNGGRPGVRVTAAHSGLSASGTVLTLIHRIYHGAHEPVIDYHNYRVSYFLKKPGPPVWTYTNTVNAGCTPAPSYTSQTLAPGPTWNQRLILSFPVQKAVPFLHLDWYQGQGNYIHEGALYPQRTAYEIRTGFTSYDWTTDWSSEPATTAVGIGPFYPIVNDWTDPNLPNQAVTKYLPNNCSNNVTTTITRQLVEEWDGYVWRRAHGDAPVSGRELNNIVVKDTLPAEVTFAGFFPGYPAGSVSGNVITWPTISQLNITDSIVYKFWVTVKDATYFGCPAAPSPASFTNRASAKADKEPLALSSATTNVSCTAVPVMSASMTKTANKATYSVGEAIVYTLRYKNLDGTIVQGNTIVGDWVPRLGGTAITLNSPTQINLATGWINRSWTYRYSHGTDGIIKGSITQPIDRTYHIMMRHDGTNWTEVRLRCNTGNNITVQLFNMPANAQIGTTQTIAYTTTASTSYDFQIQLSGADVNIWILTPSGVPGAPTFTITGATIQAGYAGIRSNLGDAGAVLNNWYTHLDSDFDLQMTDPIPAQVTFVSANTTTYNATPYTGSNVAGTVTWATIPGPVLADEEITYTWNGTVNTCATSITNTAVAKIRGVTPDPAGTVVVGCNVSVPVTLVDFRGSIQGENAVLTWTTTTERNNHYFIVEKSYNGTDFNPVGRVNGHGNSNIPLHYQYTDYQTGHDKVYYRLVQVDYDNTRTNSNIICLRPEGSNAVKVYPNPFTSETIVRVDSDDREPVTITVMSVNGFVVYTSGDHYTNEEIKVGEGLANGVYILKVTGREDTQMIRLVKNK